eukprot:2957385-Rhodomonas_salina.3
MQDHVNADPNNGSYYLEAPLDWMQEAAQDVQVPSIPGRSMPMLVLTWRLVLQGKFNCPGCDARVGRLSWVGYEAMPGRELHDLHARVWITPCIMLTRSKVDAKRFPEGEVRSLPAVMLCGAWY